MDEGMLIDPTCQALPHPHCEGMSELVYASAERIALRADHLRGAMDDDDALTESPSLCLATDVIQYHILLGLAVTGGSAFGHEAPGEELCRQLFTEACDRPDKQAVQLHKGGKALTKHCHRASSGWWGPCTGRPLDKNISSEAVLDRIIAGATWRNVFWLPHNILAYEIRVAEGYGVRYQQDLKAIEPAWTFRGFVEPAAAGDTGHTAKWRH